MSRAQSLASDPSALQGIMQGMQSLFGQGQQNGQNGQNGQN